MKNHFFLFLKIFLSIVLGVGCLIETYPAEANEIPKKIVCYYLSWTSHYKHPFNYDTKDIPTELCTDIVYALMTFDNVTFELKSQPYQDVMLRQFTALRMGSSSDTNFLLSVGGAVDNSSKWSTMVADAYKRSLFVTSALRMLKDYGFNGLDLYWNNPKPKDKENYVHLVEELVMAFKPSRLLLSCTVNFADIVYGYNEAESGYDIQRLSELVSWINVKTFYLRGPWNNFVDVHSPLFKRPFEKGEFQYVNLHDGLELMVRLGSPRHKLIVGIAFFGQSFTLQSASDNYLSAPANKSAKAGDPGPVTQEKGFLAYYEICRNIASGKWTRRFDYDGKCPYAFHGNQWVGYEDEQSIRIKMEYIKNRGFGGAYAWAVNFDDFNGFCGPENALLHTIKNALSTKKNQYNCGGSELLIKQRFEAMGIMSMCKCQND